MDFSRDRRTFFIADAPRGGGENDPHDYDDQLARQFKAALGQAYDSHTPGTSELLNSIEGILDRARNAGHYLLLSQDLQPIAKRILEIPGYSDKRNPVILTDKFEGFDLSVDP
jgi:hypothetical protein